MERERFNIGCFNLCNLVARGQRFYGGHVYEGEDYDRKIAWISSQLDAMEADVIGFQEIFDPASMRAALDGAQATRGFELVVSNASGHHPEVGIATRYEVLEHEHVEAFPERARLTIDELEIPIDRFTHGVLRAKVRLPAGLDAWVYVVHLKSKRPKFASGVDRHDPYELAAAKARSLIIRSAEALALRALLLEHLEDRDDPVVLIGDLNDSEGAVTTEVAAGQMPERHWRRDVKTALWDVLLYNAKSIQARQSLRDVYYTHIHNGSYEALDHILLSEQFNRDNRHAPAYVEYVRVFNDHLIDESLSSARIPIWRSDHGQVVATIVVR
jgi:endonuclease/exonuclease/phosphatase family metal-dependent hydrolase